GRRGGSGLGGRLRRRRGGGAGLGVGAGTPGAGVGGVVENHFVPLGIAAGVLKGAGDEFSVGVVHAAVHVHHLAGVGSGLHLSGSARHRGVGLIHGLIGGGGAGVTLSFHVSTFGIGAVD